MSKGLIFWVLMLLWLVLGIAVIFTPRDWVLWMGHGNTLLLFLLFLLLGWQVFGAPVK